MENTTEQYWQAVLNRDSDKDGLFYYGVLTTGVYCRPSCAARTPLRINVRYYPTQAAAQKDALRACKRCKPDYDYNAQDSLIQAMCRYIEDNYQQRLTLNDLAKQAGLSPSHFQRIFKQVVGMSPKKYQDAWRMNKFKSQLKSGEDITDAIHNVGYESSSRIYEKLDTHMGMTPTSYRKGGDKVQISYASQKTSLGIVMVGATDRGICFLQFDDEVKPLLEQLKLEYPKAEVIPMPKNSQLMFKQWMDSLNQYLEGQVNLSKLPLDIFGTAFQKMVWEYLITIPAGELKSYKEVADAIGKPSAFRAVASACGNNKIAIAIPCHRVIRGDGSLAGFKWGLPRKRTLIDLERKRERDLDA